MKLFQLLDYVKRQRTVENNGDRTLMKFSVVLRSTVALVRAQSLGLEEATSVSNEN